MPRQWSLRSALSVPFALVLSLVILLMALMHYRTVSQMGEHEAVNFLRSSNAQVASELSRLLALPFHLQRLAALQIARSNYYTPGDLRAVQQYLEQSFNAVYLSDDTHVSMVQLGTENGDFVAVSFRPEDGMALHLKDQRTAGALVVTDMHTGQVKRSRTGYDPRVRPWYTPVAQSHTARWTPLYAASTDPSDVGISATYPLFSEDTDRHGRRRFLGVLGSDISLSSLTKVLTSAPLATTFNSDVSYIMEENGHLVAQSGDGPLVKFSQGGTPPTLLMATDSPDPLVAQSALILGPYNKESTAEATHRLRWDGRDFVVQVRPFVDPKGIDWRLVSVVAKDELTQSSTREANLALLAAAVFAVLGLYSALAIVQTVVTPVEKTALAAKGLAQAEGGDGASPWHVPQVYSRVSEVALLVESFQGMAQRIAEQMQHLKHLALRDNVTGLLNTSGIADAARWSGSRHAMLVKLGVGNYAVVTALMPPRFADELSRALATRLSAAGRSAWLIARVDGGAFVFLFVDQTPAQCEAALALLQAAFASPFAVGDDEISLHAALGVSQAHCKAAEVTTRLLPEASLALASVARRSGDHLVLFDDSLYTEAAAAARAEVELRNAVAAHEFEVYFQPIVDLATEAVVGVESLVRWPHPKRGMVPPSEFIPLAEESGLIVPLGDWILRKACEEGAALQRAVALRPSFFVNVNVSVRQLLQSDFVEVVQAALTASGLAASQLKIEITESLLLQENTSTLETIAALQNLGVRFALDDFGTGYSSLSYLNRFRFHAVKVDRSLLLAAAASGAGRTILKSAQELICALKAQSVVEGIETREQVALVRELGFEQGQGYLFARPMPIAELRKWLGAVGRAGKAERPTSTAP
jgi:EAL domain-containing protein (putative c-di-GMP-specific phosphodiesterase class I)/GGDEF domain-containing protein